MFLWGEPCSCNCITIHFLYRLYHCAFLLYAVRHILYFSEIFSKNLRRILAFEKVVCIIPQKGEVLPTFRYEVRTRNLIARNFRSNVFSKVSVKGYCTMKPVMPMMKSGGAEKSLCLFLISPCMKNSSFTLMTNIFKTKKQSRAINRQERKSRRSCPYFAGRKEKNHFSVLLRGHDWCWDWKTAQYVTQHGTVQTDKLFWLSETVFGGTCNHEWLRPSLTPCVKFSARSFWTLSPFPEYAKIKIWQFRERKAPSEEGG